MNFKEFCLILLAFLSVTVKQTQQASLPTDPYYTAGVVEFSPSSISNTTERLEDHLNKYIEIISSKDALPTDIIIFPEATLNNEDELTFVPDEESEIIPCESKDERYHKFLRSISCAARKAAKYVVINLSEKENCPAHVADKRPCAKNGLNIYNTNVVFDRNGCVISRYRKVHLYGEPKNTTLEPEFGIFDTDFDVRFGHFVCFDILFYKPAEEMVKTMGITDFILTTMWFGQLPFLTGVQIQNSWAYANNVNLLAAGASVPNTGTTGSGIYNGRNGTIVSVMHRRVGERKIYVAQVPKFPDQIIRRSKRETKVVARPRLSNADISLKRDYLENYESVLVSLTNASYLEQELCYTHNQFCCKFKLHWQQRDNLQPNSKYYTYRLGVFDGYRNEAAAETNHIKTCAIFTCIGDTIADCGKLFPDDARVRPQLMFKNIVIESSFPRVDEFLLMPNSLRENLLPVKVENFKWTETEEDNKINVRYELNATLDDLLTMAIYGNYYDTPVEKKDSASAAKVSSILMILVIAWYLY